MPVKPTKADAPPKVPATPERGTVTFVPYYWEAYNEIVQPLHWREYFIDKWAAQLGPTAAMIVTVLRRKCFYNRSTGQLRNTCELTVKEIAVLVGVSASTIERQFRENDTLALFVRKQQQYQQVGSQIHQAENKYHVAMDDPIHPDDIDRYEELRALKERTRDVPLDRPNVRPDPNRVRKEEAKEEAPAATAEVDSLSKSLDRHFDGQDNTGNSYDRQNDGHNGNQNDGHIDRHIDGAIDKLPSGGVNTKESNTALPVPPINSPQGETDAKPEDVLWYSCLTELQSLTDETGKPVVNKPTYETHFRPMRLVELVLEEGKVGRAQIFCEKQWTVEWVGKRYAGHIEEIVSKKLGRLVQISLEVPK